MSQVTRTVRWGLILTLLSGANGCIAQHPAVATWEPDARQQAILGMRLCCWISIETKANPVPPS